MAKPNFLRFWGIKTLKVQVKRRILRMHGEGLSHRFDGLNGLRWAKIGVRIIRNSRNSRIIDGEGSHGWHGLNGSAMGKNMSAEHTELAESFRTV